MHCDEILRRAQVFNERLRRKYGIVPEKYPVDEDTRPRFLRTPDRHVITAARILQHSDLRLQIRRKRRRRYSRKRTRRQIWRRFAPRAPYAAEVRTGVFSGRLRPPFTPYPGKTDKATRDLARLIVFNLANPVRLLAEARPVRRSKFDLLLNSFRAWAKSRSTVLLQLCLRLLGKGVRLILCECKVACRDVQNSELRMSWIILLS